MRLTDELLDVCLEYQKAAVDEVGSDNTPASDILGILQALKDQQLEAAVKLTKKQQGKVNHEMWMHHLCGQTGDDYEIEKRFGKMALESNCSIWSILEYMREREYEHFEKKIGKRVSPKTDLYEECIRKVQSGELYDFGTAYEYREKKRAEWHKQANEKRAARKAKEEKAKGTSSLKLSEVLGRV